MKTGVAAFVLRVADAVWYAEDSAGCAGMVEGAVAGCAGWCPIEAVAIDNRDRMRSRGYVVPVQVWLSSWACVRVRDEEAAIRTDGGDTGKSTTA